VTGLHERWGRDVLHCPYCHGWEVRDQAVGVLASGPKAVHIALLFRQLTPEVVDERLTGVRMRDGTLVARQALVVTPRFVARSEVLANLGLGPTAQPLGVGESVTADASGLTDVPGVWVAGNVTNLMAWVVTAAAEGVSAAAAINADLVTEDTRRTVSAKRNAGTASSRSVAMTAS